MTAERKFTVVPKDSAPEPKPVEPEEALTEIVPELAAAEATVARLRNRMDEARRLLAFKRGVAFIRAEHVRREFAER